jgi:hypothetical protein
MQEFKYLSDKIFLEDLDRRRQCDHNWLNYLKIYEDGTNDGVCIGESQCSVCGFKNETTQVPISSNIL